MIAAAQAVQERLNGLDGVIVGFSGGVDSGLLADLAAEALGTRAVIVTAVSPSLPARERAAAAAVAAERGWRHLEVETGELDRPEYVANAPNRCFHCRSEFFESLEPLKERLGIAAAAVGTVVDDLGDHRPGQDAAARRGVLTPLADAGLTKAAVRAVARERGLTLWDKPASACLSSRIPYGTPVTVAALRRIEQAEDALHDLGFAVCRVRDHGRCARIEVPVDRLAELLAVRDTVAAALKHAGYAWVALDLDGFRSGSMNNVLPTSSLLPVLSP